MSNLLDLIDQNIVKDPYKNPHNPENFAGCWIVYHILGRDSKTKEEKINAAGAIIRSMMGLGCEKCVNHIKAWLVLNPIQQTWTGDNENNERALFDWTVRAHNYANSNAGHPEMSLEKAYNIWYLKKDCGTKTCSTHGREAALVRSRNYYH